MLNRYTIWQYTSNISSSLEALGCPSTIVHCFCHPAAVGFRDELREKGEVLGGIAPGRLQQDQNQPWRWMLGWWLRVQSWCLVKMFWHHVAWSVSMKCINEVYQLYKSTAWVLVALQNAECVGVNAGNEEFPHAAKDGVDLKFLSALFGFK